MKGKVVYDAWDQPEYSVIWDKLPQPTPTSVMTVACWLCGKPADLLDPDSRFSIVDEVHESCRDRDPNEPDDPDWKYEEGLL